LETKHNRRMVPRPKLFVSKGRLHKQRPQHQKQSWVHVLLRVGNVAWKISMIKEWHQDQGCLLQQGVYRCKGQNYKKKSVMGSSPVEDSFCSCNYCI
jgi:hypothetical protein